ncbi:MAG: hypothetical protein FJY85_11860 [Deltaproteobacteria bacterium]|nr:hypothetical protein [Deltaproteobacteria bacterium]
MHNPAMNIRQWFPSFLALALAGCTSVQSPPVSEPAPITSSPASSISSIQAFPYVPPGEEMSNPDELPFSYNAGSLDLKLYRFTEPASDEFDYLVKNSADTSCAPKRPAGYFEALAKTFAGATKTTYAFQAQSGPYRGSVFQLVLIPNRQHYRDVEKVREDFYACHVGAMIAFKVSPEWLLLESGCGGVDEGCGVIGDQLKPTIHD